MEKSTYYTHTGGNLRPPQTVGNSTFPGRIYWMGWNNTPWSGLEGGIYPPAIPIGGGAIGGIMTPFHSYNGTRIYWQNLMLLLQNGSSYWQCSYREEIHCLNSSIPFYLTNTSISTSKSSLHCRIESNPIKQQQFHVHGQVHKVIHTLLERSCFIIECDKTLRKCNTAKYYQANNLLKNMAHDIIQKSLTWTCSC